MISAELRTDLRHEGNASGDGFALERWRGVQNRRATAHEETPEKKQESRYGFLLSAGMPVAG